MNSINTKYTNKMRSITAITLAAFVLSACGGKPEGELAELIAQRDSLESAGKAISAELASVRERIKAMDTVASELGTNVTALSLKPADFAHYFTVQGVVEAEHNAQIYPEAAALITSIHVKEGDRVEKGQTLITLDHRVISSNIDEARTALELAKTLYEKQEKLWNQKIGSEVQYLQAKTNYEGARDRVETLEAQRALFVMKAPFAGIVDEIVPKEGEMANPAAPAIRLINMDDVYIKADVTEGYLNKIKAGDSVNVSFPSLGISKASRVTRKANFINPNNRTFKIRIDLKNQGLEVKPNLLAEVKIRDYYADSTISIPSRLIQMTPSGEEFVYVAEGPLDSATARRVMIKSGVSYNDTTEILSGLKEGDVLIDKGARAIKDGDLVSIQQ